MGKATKISIINSIFLLVLVVTEMTGVIKYNLIFSFNVHKLLHILGVAMFFGNMIVGPVWLFMAIRSKNMQTVRFAFSLLALTDIAFTVTGIDLTILNGLFMASVYGGTQVLPWIKYSVHLLFAMWILSIPVIYIQEMLYKEGKEADSVTPKMKKYLILWSIWGSILSIPPSIVFYLMVVKGW